MGQSPNRRAGRIFFKVDGQMHDAKGSFTYNLGQPKRDAIVGTDAVHGFSEKVQIPFIEGEVTDRTDLDLETFLNLTDVNVTLELANGKTIILHEAWFAGEGSGQTDEANIQVRFEGLQSEESK